MANAEEVACALGGKRQGGEWRAYCPAHNDGKSPSLMLRDGDRGKLVWKCFGGCSQEAVAEALRARGFLGNGDARAHRSPFYIAKLGEPCSVYDYRDRDGRIAFHVARYESVAGDKQIRPWRPNGAGGLEARALPPPRPLYRLPELVAHDRCTVLVVEGEKCVDAAAKLLDRYAVTTWSGGVAGVKDAELEPLKDRRVLIWPDADKAGQAAALTLAKALERIARRVAMLRIDGRPEGWDVADAIAEGWTADDLRTFIDEHGGAAQFPRGISGKDLVEMDIPPPAFLCDPWAPEGLLILAGRPKLGKTTLLRQKAAAIASGGEFFGEPCVASAVLFLSLEENARQMRDKLKACGFGIASIDLHFEWPRGLAGVAQLVDYLDANPGVRYVVIDSLTRIRDLPTRDLPGFVADYESVAALQNITKTRPGLLIETLHHARKTISEDPIDDISGTYGVSAACDSFAIMRRRDDGASLHVGGRQWTREASDFRLSKGGGLWHFEGEALPSGLTRRQEEAVAELRRAGGMMPNDFATARGISRQSARELLNRLVAQGVAERRGDSYFAL